MLDRFLISEANKSPVVKDSLDAIRHTFKRVNSTEVDLTSIPIIFVSPQRIERESMENFIINSYLGSRFQEHNLPPDILFKPRTFTAITGGANSRILISSSSFAPLWEAPTSLKSREDISARSLILFSSVYPLLLETQSQEVRLEGLPQLKRDLLSRTFDFLDEKSASFPNPETTKASNEIKDYLLDNGDLYIIARGTRLEIKIRDQIVMSFMDPYNFAIKNLLTFHAAEEFIDYMSKKHRWFYPPPSIPRYDVDPDIEKEAQGFLEELGILDNPKQIFDYLETSRLGVEMANHLEQQLEEEEKRFEESLKQLKIHGIGPSDEDQPLVTYPTTIDPEVETEEQTLQLTDEEDDLLEDEPVIIEVKKGRQRIQPD